jgi:hypothetical protein
MHLGGSDREVSGVARSPSYSSGVISIRSVQASSAHSHTHSEIFTQTDRASLTALMRSFTSRNSAWFSPTRLSCSFCSVGMDMLAPRFPVWLPATSPETGDRGSPPHLPHLIVDISPVQLIDSSIINLLIQLKKDAGAKDCRFNLVMGTGPGVERALEICEVFQR